MRRAAVFFPLMKMSVKLKAAIWLRTLLIQFQQTSEFALREVRHWPEE